MKTVHLCEKGNFNVWREQARALIHAAIPPEEVIWTYDDNPSLFASENLAPQNTSNSRICVSKKFLSIADQVICHNGDDTPALLYRLLFRLQDDKELLDKLYDKDMIDALSRQKAVGHDIHHMHAFVRFKEISAIDDRRCFTAWYEPQHFIIQKAAPFFCKRFSDMDWQILTPKGCAYFFRQNLTLGKAVDREPPLHDTTEELWKTYFSSIFNPARVKLKTMQNHMPKKFWRNLPEATIINDLVEGAQARVEAMQAQQLSEAPLFHQRLQMRQEPLHIPEDIQSLDDLRQNIKVCQRCPIHCNATQAVCGEGPAHADIMVIGEQPGDREDLVGKPFVGPAGQLFDQVAQEIGLDRKQIYVTNAVKHFKYEMRGKKRIHNTANRSEIKHCRWWLLKEIALIKPKLVVTMGKTAFFSVTEQMPAMSEIQGKIATSPTMPPILPTVHPSYLLRIKDQEFYPEQLDRFKNNLLLAMQTIHRLSNGL